MPEYEGQQKEIARVEKEAGEKKVERLEKTLSSKHDLVQKDVSSCDKIIEAAEKTITDEDLKLKLSHEKQALSTWLQNVINQGSAILKNEGNLDAHYANLGLDTVEKWVESIKKDIPFFEKIQKSKDLQKDMSAAQKKAQTLSDKDASKKLSDAEKSKLLSDFAESITKAEEPLVGLSGGGDKDLQTVYDNTLKTITDAKVELGKLDLENMTDAMLKSNPELSKLKSADQDFSTLLPDINKAIELKNSLLQTPPPTPEQSEKNIVEMKKIANEQIDKLAENDKKLSSIDKSKITTYHLDAYLNLAGRIQTGLKEMMDIKMYCATKDLAQSKEMGVYFTFGMDGTITPTKEFNLLSEAKQKELVEKFKQLRYDIAAEVDEKLALPEEKALIDGKKKLATGDWIGAKQDLLNFLKTSKDSKNSRAEVKTVECKEMLKQIAKIELAQCAKRILAMKSSIQGRDDNEVLSPTAYGAWKKWQGERWCDGASQMVAKAESFIDSGEAITIEEAEAKVRALNPKDDTDPISRGHLQDFQQGYPVAGIDGKEAGKVNDIYDVFKQQRLLNNPDEKVRKEALAALAKKARDNGLPELARQYYDQYFEADYNEASKTITREDVAKEFFANKENSKKLDEQIKRWRDEYRKDLSDDDIGINGQIGQPNDDVDKVRAFMVKEMIDVAYGKAVKLKVHQKYSSIIQGEKNKLSQEISVDPISGKKINVNPTLSGQAHSWDDAYNGVVALENFGQDGLAAMYSDEEWNQLPRKTMVGLSITIASAGVASGVVSGVGSIARMLAPRAVASVLGSTVTVGSTELAIGKGAAALGNLGVESMAFVAAQDRFSHLIEKGSIFGDYMSPSEYAKAVCHNILVLGTLKGVGTGYSKLQGLRDYGILQPGALEQAAWWTGRTATEGAALTGISAASAWLSGNEFSSKEAAKSFGENVVFSVGMGVSHKISGEPTHEGKDKEASVADVDAVEAIKKGLAKESDAESAQNKVKKAEEKVEKAWKTGDPKAIEVAVKELAEAKKDAKAKENIAEQADKDAGAKMQEAKVYDAKEAQKEADKIAVKLNKAGEVKPELLAQYLAAQHEAIRLSIEAQNPEANKSTTEAANAVRNKITFDHGVPKEAIEDGIPQDAKGWVDKQGNVHININYLNNGKTESIDAQGKPKSQKIMPEGYEVVPKGENEIMVKTPKTTEHPEGELISLKEYEKRMKGTAYEKVLIDTMVVVMTHEKTHKILTSAFSKIEVGEDGKPTRVPDPDKVAAFENLFGKPDAGGNVPPGKIALRGSDGKPLEPTWENIEEFLCRVTDGTAVISKEQAKALENVIDLEIDGFSFIKARSIANKKIMGEPSEAFTRNRMAAMMGPEIEIVGESNIKVKNLKELQDALKDPATSENAKELLQDMVAILRSPNRAEELKIIRHNYPEMSMKDILDLTISLQTAYKAEYHDLSHRFKEAVNDRKAMIFADTEISSFQRELLKLIIHEAKTTTQLLSGLNENGKTKSPTEKAADLAKLKEKITKGEIGLGELNLQVLTGSEAGSEMLNSLISNPEVAKKIIASPDGITFIREQIRDGNLDGYHKMPKEVQEALKNDAIQGFKDKLNSIENEDIRKSLLLKYSDAELAKLFKKLEKDPKFAEQTDLPSLMSLLIANHENLSLDYFQKILTGNVEYKDVQTYENGVLKNKKILVVSSDNQLGEGSFGKVRSQLIVDSKQPQYHENAVKTPHLSMEAATYYDRLSPAKKAIIDKAFASDLLDIETYRTQKANVLNAFSESRESERNAMISHLEKLRGKALETRNNLLIMKYQSMGKLQGLMRINYVAPDGSMTVMENMYDSKQQCVPTLKAMLEGKANISPENFGTFLADAIDTLQELHDLGLLHHDVKPDNIAIGPDGKIRFLDFGSLMQKEDLLKTRFNADKNPSQIGMMFELAQNGNVMISENQFGTDGFNVTPAYYDYIVGYNEGHGKVPFGMSDNEAIIRVFTYDLMGEENPYNDYNRPSPAQMETAKRLIPPAKLEILKPYIQQYHDGKIDSKTLSSIIRKTLTKPK